MYNRYIPPDTAYSPIPQEDSQPEPSETQPQPSPSQRQQPAQQPAAPQRNAPANDALGGITREANKLLGGLFKNISLENLDTGDILLILIILFLFLEGDNWDVVIALGLMLLLSLGEEEKKPEQGQTGQDAQPST